ncbi:MAG: hypothetical protein H6621_00840 [Halobacteriovoraceae bacterium]|nr:hypothetical protein [Halobacteriovoraceae bacterium]
MKKFALIITLVFLSSCDFGTSNRTSGSVYNTKKVDSLDDKDFIDPLVPTGSTLTTCSEAPFKNYSHGHLIGGLKICRKNNDPKTFQFIFQKEDSQGGIVCFFPSHRNSGGNFEYIGQPQCVNQQANTPILVSFSIDRPPVVLADGTQKVFSNLTFNSILIVKMFQPPNTQPDPVTGAYYNSLNSFICCMHSQYNYVNNSGDPYAHCTSDLEALNCQNFFSSFNGYYIRDINF